VAAAIADILSRPEAGDDLPTGGYPAAKAPVKAKRNGHKAAEADPTPKA
jgi:hypothetical protein